MQVLRDLIRDLVGILFPGGLLVAITLWSFWAIVIIQNPSTSFNFISNDYTFAFLVIISYIAGQTIRIKRLDNLEKRCTKKYRKRKLPKLNEDAWKKCINEIVLKEDAYFTGTSNIAQLKEVYKTYNEQFRYWEEFPYAYRLKGKRLLEQSENYIKFFEKYDKQGITKNKAFFNFCKSLIYEYSPPFKEEILRQESLVRLFAGIHYVVKYGKVLSSIIGIIHVFLAFSIKLKFHLIIDLIGYDNIQLSIGIFFISVFTFCLFIYLDQEILSRLRHMRSKEVEIVYDAFYIISKKNNLCF